MRKKTLRYYYYESSTQIQKKKENKLIFKRIGSNNLYSDKINLICTIQTISTNVRIIFVFFFSK